MGDRPGASSPQRKSTDTDRPAKRHMWPRAGRALLLAIAIAGGAAGVTSLAKGASGSRPWILLSVSAALFLFLLIDLVRGKLVQQGVNFAGVLDSMNPLFALTNSFLGIAAAVLTILVLSLPATAPAKSRHDPCRADLSGPAHKGSASESDQQGVQISFHDLHYSMYSGSKERATAQLYNGMYGRLEGAIPTGYAIYVLDRPDGNTKSLEGVKGYPHFYPRGRIFPDSRECWSLPPRNLGEPGTVGIRISFFFMLIPDRSVAFFERQKEWADERPPGADNPGISMGMMSKEHSQPLAILDIGTISYDYVSSISSQ